MKRTFRRVFVKPYSAFATWKEAYQTTEIVHSEDVELTEEELKSGQQYGNRWLFYAVWELSKEPEGGWEEGGKGRGRDIVLVHGWSWSCGANQA